MTLGLRNANSHHLGDAWGNVQWWGEEWRQTRSNGRQSRRARYNEFTSAMPGTRTSAGDDSSHR
jgi:hypothetical protein